VATRTQTAEAPASEPPAPTLAARRDVRAVAAVTTLVLVAFVVYAAVAQLVETPRVHPDEIIYGEAAGSLAEGDGLSLRGEEYAYGPLYPGLLAAILTVFDDRETAYALMKAANALLFALVAIPVFLLARRVLSPWWSVGAAAGALLIPSSMFVGLVMTEVVAYLAAAWMLLAIALALERPTATRQVAVLVGAIVAYTARPQLGALYGTYLVALALLWLIVPARFPRTRAAALTYWPTAASLAIAAAVFALPLLGGDSPLGAYEVLWRSYDPFVVAKWFLYHLADLELYLAVLPFAVAPIVLAGLVRRGRAGSPAAAAFAATFVAANAVGLAVVAVFASTEHGFDRLHDRNIFYLAPLWLIVLGLWLAWGLPRPLVATALGAALALGLAAFLPYRYISAEVGVDVVPSALWAEVHELGGPISGRRALALFVVALAVAAALLPRRYATALPVAVTAVLVATAVFAWEREIDAPENAVFAGSASNRSWIDETLPRAARVTKLYVDSPACPTSGVTRHALYLTEFFNGRVKRAAYVDDSVPDGLPIERVDVAGDGTFVTAPDTPLEAEYVVTQPGIELEGRRLATGSTAGLVLWEIHGPVRAIGARSSADLRTRDCAEN
jgi:hypothetical protein